MKQTGQFKDCPQVTFVVAPDSLWGKVMSFLRANFYLSNNHIVKACAADETYSTGTRGLGLCTYREKGVWHDIMD